MCMCVCVHFSVHPFVKPELVAAITCDPFKPGPPKFELQVQNTLVKIPIVLGVIDHDLQGQI